MTEEIKTKAYIMRGKLRAMKASIETDEENSAIRREKVAQMRIRKLQHSMLQHDFVEMMTDYNRQQMEHQNRHRDQIREVSSVQSRSDQILLAQYFIILLLLKLI